MLILKPEKIEFEISTTDLELVYTESGGVKVKVEAIPLVSINLRKFVSIEISFPIVVEAKCVTLNFYDHNYKNYSIIKGCFGEINLTYSGFYEVVDSKYLQDNKKVYDPGDKLDLKHYVITGYDGYVELIASKYCANELVPN